jgi:outer membrane lipoprotein SlyB
LGTSLVRNDNLPIEGAGLFDGDRVGKYEGALVGGSVGAEVGSGVGSPATYVGVSVGATEGGAVPVLVRMTTTMQ